MKKQSDGNGSLGSREEILVIGDTTYEGGERRWVFPKALADLGYRVTLITNVLPHMKMTWKPTFEKVGKVRVIKVPSFYPLLPWKGIITKTVIRLSFALSLILAIPFVGHPQIILSMEPHPFSDPLALLVKKFKKAIIFLDVSDVQNEIIKTIRINCFLSLLLNLAGRLSNIILYNNADVILTLNNSIKNIVSRYTPKKSYVVYTGVDLKRFFPMKKSEAHKSLSNNFKSRVDEDKFTILYAGLQGPIQNLQRVIDAAWKLKNNEMILFVLVGEGEETKNLKKKCTQRNLKNVVFTGKLSWQKMPYVINSADVTILPLLSHSIYQIYLPKKFYEYAACGKPIVCFCPKGEITNLVEKWNAGVTVNPNSVDELTTIIAYLSESNRTKTMGKNARHMTEELFSLSKLKNSLENIFGQKLTHKQKYT